MTSPDVRRHIHDAKADLTDALGHLQRLIPRATTIQRLTPTGDPGCASCRRNGQFSPVKPGANGLCWWCYDWKLANTTLPPLGVLEARAQGRRITTRVVDEATRRERRPKGRRKKAS